MIQSREELKRYIQQDRKMNGLAESRSFREAFASIIMPCNIPTFLNILRHAEYYVNTAKGWKVILKLYYRYRFSCYSRKLGFSISLNTCGPGLSLPHYGTIIINSNACIGENCRIHACVNIGASNGSTKAPHIGSNVYIGPSVVIFGDISIADNVTIGANATVNKSVVENNVTVAGTPAKIVKQNTPSWIEFNNL